MSDKTKSELLQTIRQNSDDAEDQGIHSLIKTGKDGANHFYLVITTNRYEGRDMLNMRYFKYIPKHNSGTWMKNGINMRFDDALPAAITQALDGVTERTIGFDRDEPTIYGLDDVDE